MYDLVELERHGVPAILVVTEGFVYEAELQSELLGMDTVRIISVEHPIASRSHKYMRDLGQRLAEECLEAASTPLV